MVLPLPADLEVLLVSLHSMVLLILAELVVLEVSLRNMVLLGLAELVVPDHSTPLVADTTMIVEVTVLRMMLSR
jgi:hypothetical protein